MKTTVILISAVLAISTSFGQLKETIIKEYVPTLKQGKKMFVPMEYGKFDIATNEQLKTLDVKNIAQVEIVCTDHPRGIDLTTLNTNRKKELLNALPELSQNADVTFNVVKQTGFTNRQEAEAMYHGLVITYQSANNMPEHLEVPFQKVTINAQSGGKVQFKQSNSTLTIPANALVDKNGNPVTGKVIVEFREWRNAADIAFSGLPMTYKHGNEEMNFNSAGMFEIQAHQENGDAVYLKKGQSATVDYEVTETIAGLDFYALDEHNEWQAVNEINFAEQEIKDEDSEWDIAADSTAGEVGEEQVLVEVAWGEDVIAWEGEMPDNGNRTANTLLAEGADKGHTYPKLVRGLNVSDFGVYNCDQIYRVPNRVNIQASYVDQDGSPIKKADVLSMVDLNYNGAFSFDPSYFICDKKGRNVILLFTKDEKLYAVNEQEFKAMNIIGSGKYEFTMTDITAQIKNTNDLRNYLGL